MDTKKTETSGDCHKYRAIYFDELNAIIEAAGKITGKRNKGFAGIILSAMEDVEGRMAMGSCDYPGCPWLENCFKGNF